MTVRNIVMAAAGSGAEPVYIEDVFSTYLYTGNGGTQTITNGIDLSGEGGLVWFKARDLAQSHILFDTNRGAQNRISTNFTSAQTTSSDSLTAFNSNGFDIGAFASINNSSTTYASWTFRKAEKFFDVVTYTGNGSTKTVSHNLGSAPGCIIVKDTSSTMSWVVYHRSNGNDKVMYLNGTQAVSTDANVWNSYTPTTTDFQVGGSAFSNSNGDTYVAYLFAHDAGGFGDSGSDNVISCGGFMTDGSGGATVNLGYEPQWVMWKRTDGTGDWTLLDNMRGWGQTVAQRLVANTSAAEDSMSGGVGFTPFPTATGFFNGNQGVANNNYIYIAIRRGPMKTPEAGTEVFSPVAYNGTGTTVIQTLSTNFPVDLYLTRSRSTVTNMQAGSRLVGQEKYLLTDLTAAEQGLGGGNGVNNDVGFASNIGIGVRGDWNNPSSPNYSPYILEAFRRAPGFFDVVCFTSTSGINTVTHGLTSVPELLIVKRRGGAGSWLTLQDTGAANLLFLEDTSAANVVDPVTYFTNNGSTYTRPTSTQFFVNNIGASTYVAYLFATVAGVSKVGTYTGTGTTLQVNCGFTGGARFVLIKRTDSTGDWYVWDSARGIVAGNDPYLLLNSTAAEVTNTDYVDTYSAGFEISSTAPAAINANGGTFIFLAIA